jgi:succinoglycan biosynthesis protein ExoA
VKEPFVSLVMAIRNESQFIQKCMESILSQDYPADRMEVLVADGMSTDGTADIVKSFQTRCPTLRVLENQGMITATGLNAAISSARGEIIVRMDGHSEMPLDYVRNCVTALQRTGAEHVGSGVLSVGKTVFGEAVALAMSTPFGVGGSRCRTGNLEEWVDTVFLGAWRREIFERIGLFDEDVGCSDDDEFNYRLLDQGGRILLSPPLRMTYYPRDKLKALTKQYFRYGFWKVRVFQKHPRQMRPSHFVPPAFAAALLVSGLWSACSAAGLIAFGAVAGAYLAANLAATLALGLRLGWKYARFLPLIFAVLHLSYGFGFLAGLVRFAGRWGDKAGRVPDLKTKITDKAEVPT